MPPNRRQRADPVNLAPNDDERQPFLPSITVQIGAVQASDYPSMARHRANNLIVLRKS